MAIWAAIPGVGETRLTIERKTQKKRSVTKADKGETNN